MVCSSTWFAIHSININVNIFILGTLNHIKQTQIPGQVPIPFVANHFPPPFISNFTPPGISQTLT